MEFTSPTGFKSPGIAADAVCLRVEDEPEVLLVRRASDPFRGAWALPGGFVDVGERSSDAAVRELEEETGVKAEVVDLLGVYDDPARDPRGHVIGIAWVCAPMEGEPQGGDDATEAKWFPFSALPDLAFDHAKIVEHAGAWLEAVSEQE